MPLFPLLFVVAEKSERLTMKKFIVYSHMDDVVMIVQGEFFRGFCIYGFSIYDLLLLVVLLARKKRRTERSIVVSAPSVFCFSCSEY